MILFRRISLGLLLLAGLGFMSLAASTYAQGPAKKDKEGGAKAPGRPVWSETKIGFEMRAKTWQSLFEWFADQTGMPFVSGKYRVPGGTFDFVNPKVGGKLQEYTLAEIFDIINEILIADHNFILLRREATLMIIPADIDPPPILIPRIHKDDLKDRAKTEIVEIVITLEVGNVEELAPGLKRQLGPFGKVTPIIEQNKLILQADVASLRRAMLDLPNAQSESTTTHNHPAKYIRASTLVGVLAQSLGASQQIVEFKGAAKEGIKDDPRFGGGGGGSTKRMRVHTITSEKSTNTVIVHGPADKIQQAKGIIRDLDKPRFDGDKGLLIGPAEIQFHDLPSGSAETMTKILAEVYKDDISVRIQVAGPSRLFVYADPQTHSEVGKLISRDFKAVAQETVVVVLNQSEAIKLVETLKVFFPDSKSGSPFIDVDVDKNAIRLKGTPDQIKEIRAVIAVLDGTPLGGAGANIRTIFLEKGSGATLAEGLYLLAEKLMPGTKVELFLPSQMELPDYRPKDKKIEEKKNDKKAEKKVVITPANLRDAIYLPKEAFTATQEAPAKEPEKKSTLRITGFGNKIIITSDDPKALDAAQQIIRMLVNTEAGPGDFEVVRLKTANSVEVAKILDEAFNGPKGQGGGRPGGGGGGGIVGGLPQMLIGGLLGGGGGGGGGRTENVRIVADPSINALLIRAKPADMLTIRRLIYQQFEVPNIDTETLVKTHTIPLKYANASHVADILKQVYAEAMTARQSQGQQGFNPFGGQTTDTSGGPRRVPMSIGVDADTNNLYISCSVSLFADVKALVDSIDETSKGSQQKAIIISLNNVEPALVQQTIDAISGKSTAKRQAADTSAGGLSGITSGAPGAFGTPGRGGFGGGFGGFGGFGGGGPIIMPGGFGGGGGGPGGGFGGGKGGGGKGPSQYRGPDFFVPPVMDDHSLHSRGPDFFVPLVKDDHSVSRLYDPFEEQEEPTTPGSRNGSRYVPYSANPLRLVSLQEEQPEKYGKDKDKDDIFSLPRLPIRIEVLPNGKILLIGNNPDDLKLWRKYFEQMDEAAKGRGLAPGSNLPGAIDIKLIPVRIADPTSIVNTLNILFSNIGLELNSTVLIPRTGGAGPGGAPPPQAAGPGGVPTAPIGTATGASLFPKNMVLIPLPRLGGILVAAQQARMADVEREIHRLDQLPTEGYHAVPFPLKRAPAKVVAASLTTFYNGRFPTPEGTANQVRITFDEGTNTVFVQASHADMIEIRRLIEHIDTTQSLADSELRVVKLKNAVARDLSEIMKAAIGQGTLTTTSTLGLTPGQTVTAGGATVTTQGTNQIANTKYSRVKLITGSKDGKPVEAYILEDIRINFDDRTNSLIISAPKDAMQLVLSLIKELDVQPIARSEINIFHLKKTDATQMALSLQQLFLNTGALGTRTAGGAAAGAIPGGAAGGAGQAGAGAKPPITITIGTTTQEGAPIIDLRLTVDERTNSLIVAGSRNDLDVIEAIIARLDDTDIQERRHEAVRLRNSQAVDVANAVTTFLKSATDPYKTLLNPAGTYLNLQREVFVIAEPISNSLLISATPKYFQDVIRLIAQIDTTPPQVVVSVLIAEVTMNGSEEFGMELGLQSPLLFERSTPVGAALTSYQTLAPGFGFSTNTPAPGAYPGTVGFQSINNLGMGRASATNGIGGFVFSASNNSVAVMVRALKTQNRLEVLSRPTLMTLDNQTALINIGKEIPLVNGFATNAQGNITPTVIRQPTGVSMQVTPRITPDGRVLMRVIPEVSSVGERVPITDTTFSFAINKQHLETTIAAADGETIVLGGLITRRDEKIENKIPWFGDLPLIGAAFRYRTYDKKKSELIIIMTPHIVRNRQEAERILSEETRRIDWSLGNVMHVHGSANCMPLLPQGTPEVQSKTQPFRIYPGNPGGAQGKPVMQVEEAPQASRTTVGKGGLIRAIINRGAGESTTVAEQAGPYVTPAPMRGGEVQYLQPPPGAGVQPIFLPTINSTPMPPQNALPGGPAGFAPR